MVLTSFAPQTILRYFRCGRAVALLALLATPPAALAQQPSTVQLESNEQIFCILAALNAGGYDTGLNAGPAEAPREEVRAYLARKNSSVVSDLGKFYADHRVPSDPGADLGQYVSLALLLGPPPDFRFTVARPDLPPDAKDVADIVPLLKTFYNQAGLLDLWDRVQPRYQAALDLYADVVRKSVVLTDAYFRFPAGAYLGRTYTIYLDLLGAPEQVQARIYGVNYYVVVTPSKQPKLNEIRHQYLHFLLDPLAAKYAPEIHQKLALRAIAYDAPSLAADFKEDFPLLVSECLIRAAELRMDKQPKAVAEPSLDAMTASGLILVRYFYEALQKYEEQESSMAVFYRQMILDISLTAERKRLALVKFTPRAEPTTQAAAPAISEEERLLNQGDNFFFEGRYNDAKTAYRTVLEKFNAKSGRALFGMAVVESNLGKPDLAEEYFQKTLEMGRDLRIITWSHIYLGRIWDLKGQRAKALSQYRAASLTATAFPDAWGAVQAGLERPFGSRP